VSHVIAAIAGNMKRIKTPGIVDAKRRLKARIEHTIDHCEPEFIQELKSERETWIADNMRHEILNAVRKMRV